MVWQVKHNPDQQRFEVDLGDATAMLEYVFKGDRLVFTHTDVPPAYGGKGIAGALVKEGLNYAREEGYKVVPMCSFVAAYIKRHPEYNDLLP